MARVNVQTFGCQMNVHDSERMLSALEGHGYEATESPTDCDVVVVNTCSVREKAEHKLMSMLGRLREWKAERPARRIAVAGCVASQTGESLLHKAPWVDVVLGPDRISDLPRLLEEVDQGAPPRVAVDFDYEAPDFLTPSAAQPVAGERAATFVTVMKGCDERCTFCIVPYTRGSERYRPAADIVQEIGYWTGRGVREVTLLGQTVNSWHEPGAKADRKTPSNFAALLRQITSAHPELLRLRYTSPHPRHVTDALVEAYAELPQLCAHVHLPVQSGSDAQLKRMLRRYSRASYLEAIGRLRGARQGMTFSTDIIVGFPGETEADFAQTLSLIEEVGFTSVFAFKYSPRPYTPALKLDGAVPETVKEARLARLFELSQRLQAEHLKRLEGQEVEVLIEDAGRQPGAWRGRSERHEIVHLQAPELKVGDLVRGRVIEALAHSLKAEVQTVLQPAPRRAPDAPQPMRLPVVA